MMENLRIALLEKIGNKTKPMGSLGRLEEIALQIGLLQESLSPKLSKPTVLIFAGDHGAANEPISAFPQAVTAQMVFNFLRGGAAINVFARQADLSFKVVDCGVCFDFTFHPEVNSIHFIDAKIGFGTRSYFIEPAMSEEECKIAFERAAQLIEKLYLEGTNIVIFGEMGIGNTSSSSLIFSKIFGREVTDFIGRGTGLNDDGYLIKVDLLQQAAKRTSLRLNAIEALREYGGFEIAMMAGAFLAAHSRRMLILVDGFIATAAFAVAHSLNKNLSEACIFSHTSAEKGHELVLQLLEQKPLLSLGLRLGEGTGAVLAYPIVENAVNFLCEMASFGESGVSVSKASESAFMTKKS
ncbi:MAG: nicotinate-nucleotide--dimethylbenzimidazole phosphoribosyltransferase [Chloroherpetonaceae bacterium]|nr:nicotinate-nucleotide--dimethylbenzimidazole phosphoribosyltransferase [Chloroherpetonaceae bacterium]